MSEKIVSPERRVAWHGVSAGRVSTTCCMGIMTTTSRSIVVINRSRLVGYDLLTHEKGGAMGPIGVPEILIVLVVALLIYGAFFRSRSS